MGRSTCRISSRWRGILGSLTGSVRSVDTGHALVFDDNEWTAFRLGATDGEFAPSPFVLATT